MDSIVRKYKNLFYGISSFFLFTGCEDIGGEMIYVSQEEHNDFNFPYLLFVPDDLRSDNNLTLIVEPNNSGFVSDDLSEHEGKARRQATKDFYLGNYVARKLKAPLLVPVFPRPKEEWRIYTHALDRDVMLQKNNDMERIDLQLIAMIDDARNKLSELGYEVEQKVLMTGFSASGTFANRFSFIHPNRVKAYAAGGLNGLLILPLDSLQGKQLKYPVGASDFQILFDKPRDSVSFKNLPQYLFMGALDDNDAIPYEDAYDVEERELIFEVLGKQMQPERWNHCKNIYNERGVNAEILIYQGIGHEHPENVKEDIVSFFKTVM